MPNIPSPDEFNEGYLRSGVELDALGAQGSAWGAHALALRARRATRRAERLRGDGAPERAQAEDTKANLDAGAAGRAFLRFEDQRAKARISALGERVIGLRGRLLDTKGRSLADHTVVLTDETGQRVFGHGETNFRGWFAFRAGGRRGQGNVRLVASGIRAFTAAGTRAAPTNTDAQLDLLIEKWGNAEGLGYLLGELGSVAVLEALLDRVGSVSELAAQVRRAGAATVMKEYGVSATSTNEMTAKTPGTTLLLQGRDRNGIVIAQRELVVYRGRVHIRADLRTGTGRGRHGVLLGGEFHVEPLAEAAAVNPAVAAPPAPPPTAAVPAAPTTRRAARASRPQPTGNRGDPEPG